MRGSTVKKVAASVGVSVLTLGLVGVLGLVLRFESSDVRIVFLFVAGCLSGAVAGQVLAAIWLG